MGFPQADCGGNGSTFADGRSPAASPHLIGERGCNGQGVEIDGDDVLACIAAGVPVTEGAIETVLLDFEDGAFDVVIASGVIEYQKDDREALLPREGQRRFLEADGWVAWPGPAMRLSKTPLITPGAASFSNSLIGKTCPMI